MDGDAAGWRSIRFIMHLPLGAITAQLGANREGGHMVGAKERWRELRAQGELIDAAARAAPGRRRLEAVPEGTSAAKPLGLVWVLSPSYSITIAGLKKVLEGKADVKIGGGVLGGEPLLRGALRWGHGGGLA